MGLTVTLDAGRGPCLDSVRAFVGAVDSLSEYELLGGSRCHGWTRLDVVTHVVAGWQEMLGGLVSPVDEAPSVDSASYWLAFAEEYGGEDPVSSLMSQRRRTAAYARPAAATAHLQDVGAAVMRGVDAFADQACLWQGHVFAPGDFLTVWAVENVVHHLDLQTEEAAPDNALHLARTTIEALVEAPLPESWTDEAATLIGTGRRPVPEGLGTLAGRLPALG